MEPIKKNNTQSKSFQGRLKYLREGQEYFQRKSFNKASGCYFQYLSILEQHYGVEKNSLHPNLFNKEDDGLEIFLISNVYLNLAKIYDLNPELYSECVRNLKQFTTFTLEFSHQHTNAMLLKKYIRKKSPKNKKEFEKTYEIIKVKYKGCFIATYSLGQNHKITNELRKFRETLLKIKFGRKMVDIYYKYSPSVVMSFEHHKILRICILPLVKISLALVASAHRLLRK